MQLQCPSASLVEGLAIVVRAAAARSTLPILEGVLLEANADTLTLTCTDQALLLRHTIHADVTQEGSVVLPARLLLEVARKMPTGNLHFEMDERYQVRFICMGTRTTLSGMIADEFPKLPQINFDRHILMEPSALRDAIRQTTYAISTDESRPLLTGCLFETEPTQTGGVLHIVATDGFRLGLRRLTLSEAPPPMRAVVPGKPLNEVARLLEGEDESVALDISASYWRIDVADTCMLIRLLEGEYLQYKKILPTEYSTRIQLERQALDAAIDRASLLARENKNNLIRLNMENDVLTITSASELGDLFEQIPISFEGKPLEIAFNVKFLSDMVRNLEDDRIEMRFINSVTPCIVRPIEGDDYLYLLLPVRIYSN